MNDLNTELTQLLTKYGYQNYAIVAFDVSGELVKIFYETDDDSRRYKAQLIAECELLKNILIRDTNGDLSLQAAPDVTETDTNVDQKPE